MTNSREMAQSRREMLGNRLIATAYPILLLLAAFCLLMECLYRPNGAPEFITVGNQIGGPGFWSARLALPLGVLIVSNIAIVYSRRSEIASSQLHGATILLGFASAGLILLLASSVVLGPFRPEVVAVGDPSELGCQIYLSRQDVLSGAGGELLMRRPGESALIETGERWAARGGPDFTLEQYIDVSWAFESATVLDISGDDPSSFYYRGTERFSC